MAEEVSPKPVGCDNSGLVPLRVPGFGLPISWSPTQSPTDDSARFKHGANDFVPDRMTAREVAMLQFMDAITDKPDWQGKVFDNGITKKWHGEATANANGLMSDKAFEWCLEELRDRATAFNRDGLVRTLECANRVIKSDVVISSALQEQLQEAVEPLLHVDDAKKDWHPNSNEQVLNLVHPSLYPFVYGRSKALTTDKVGLHDCMASAGMGSVSEGGQSVPNTRQAQSWRPSLLDGKTFWSGRFQWLPAEVRFTGDCGTDVRLTSYINNLHTVTNKPLYGIVEKLISAAIPAWNEVLIEGYKGRNDLRIKVRSAEIEPPDEPDWGYDWAEENETNTANDELLTKIREYLKLPDNPDRTLYEEEDTELPENLHTSHFSEWDPPEEQNYAFYEGWLPCNLAHWKYNRIRRVILPEPGVKYTYEQWVKGEANDHFGEGMHNWSGDGFARDHKPIKLEDTFRQSGLQVIVKLSSIELSPEKPSYAGGSWHLEGMLNEHIVATAIYYYDVNNCTESRLRFRQEADGMDDLGYPQNDHGPLAMIFGTERMTDEPAVQEIGSVDTREGRLLVFPNTLQHKVEPFQLIDASKSGHRRFIVLWLVDPHYRVLSTANVPPQQEDWWAQHVRADDWNRDLPQEIKDEIVGYAKDGMITMEEAKKLRLELMAERTTFTDTVERGFQSYNFCEH